MKKKLIELLNDYKKRAIKRKEAFNLLPRPLDKEEVEVLVQGLTLDNLDQESFAIFNVEQLDQLIISLLKNGVRRGTFPSSYVKAEGLAGLVRGEEESRYLSAEEALDMLKEMMGGAASVELVKLLEEGYFTEKIIKILKDTVLVNKEEFDKLLDLVEADSTTK